MSKPHVPTNKEIVAALEACLMNAVVELRRLAAVERELEALKASIGEPVAWRYKDSRGHYRYCGYKTGFDTEHSLLKPIPLYAIAKDKP